MMVTVLGTKFHLRSYSDENYESAMLLSGAINISKQVKKNGLQKVYETVALKPSESVVFNDILKEEEIVPADTVKNPRMETGRTALYGDSFGRGFQKSGEVARHGYRSQGLLYPSPHIYRLFHLRISGSDYGVHKIYDLRRL